MPRTWIARLFARPAHRNPARPAPVRPRLSLTPLEDRTVPTTVTGFAFQDANANGVRDTGEYGVPGIRLALYNGSTLVGSGTTGPDGTVAVPGISPGAYTYQFRDADGTNAIIGGGSRSLPGATTVAISNIPITLPATSTALTASPTTSGYGSSVTFTATVTAASGTPAGAVQFYQNGTALGSPVSLSGGAASLSVTNLGVGTQVITATYTGSATYAGSTSAAVNETVLPVVSVAAVSDASEGGASGTFRFTRTGDTSSSLTVGYTVGGTATAGTDYTALTGTVTFNPGDDYADVSVVAGTDSVFDPNETVSVTVSASISYDMSLSAASITIYDSAPIGFVLGSNTGTANFTIPWDQVDDTQATQSLSLTNFSLTLAGQTFTQSNASFTVPPTAEFAYGVLVGYTFAIDTSAIAGYAYTSISMNGGMTISAVNAVTSTTDSTDVVAKPEVKVTKADPGTAVRSVHVKASWTGCMGAKYAIITITGPNGAKVTQTVQNVGANDKLDKEVGGLVLPAGGDVTVFVEVYAANNSVIMKSASVAGKTK